MVDFEGTATPRLAILGIRAATARDRFYPKCTYPCWNPGQSRVLKTDFRTSKAPATTPRWFKNCFVVGWGARNTKSALGTTPLPLRAENLVLDDGTG